MRGVSSLSLPKPPRTASNGCSHQERTKGWQSKDRNDEGGLEMETLCSTEMCSSRCKEGGKKKSPRNESNEPKGACSGPVVAAVPFAMHATHSFILAFSAMRGKQVCLCVCCVAKGTQKKATWLILPVVICLSQRLSHACLSINSFIL